MENIISLEAAMALIAGESFLQYSLDLLIKSFVIIGFTYLIAFTFREKISNNGAHLLWLNSMLCVAVLPLAMASFSSVALPLLNTAPVTVFAVDVSPTAHIEVSSHESAALFGFVYAAIAAVLVLRLMLSAIALQRIDADAQYCLNETILKQIVSISNALDISRRVVVKTSKDVASPMSFGLFKPVVVLPELALEWSESTLEDVLLHELSHIKRLDWVTMLFCHVVASLLWINPLVWFVKKRVNDSAEQACDAAVLRYGKDSVKYAEDLLRLARESIVDKRAPILAQLMFDKSGLSLRIRNILDGRLIAKVSKGFVSTLLVSTFLVVSGCSGINLFGAKLEDQEFSIAKADPPLYPRRAADEGIEGWVWASFTVTAQGEVRADSIEILDAEPSDIFNRASTRALEKFEFQPRIQKGKAVEIEGVEYVFRYELPEPREETSEQRSPPRARKRDGD